MEKSGAPRIPPLPDDGNQSVIRSGDWELHTQTRELFLGGVAQSLEPKTFELLTYLIAHRDRVVSKDELLDRIWTGTVVSESVVARAVMKARKALGDFDADPRYIKTLHRVGYRFIGKIRTGHPGVTATTGIASTDFSSSVYRPTAPTASGWNAYAMGGRLAANGGIRVALMPIANRTGNSELDWVELGLLAVISNNMAEEPSVSTLAVKDILAILRSLPEHASPEEQGAAIVHAHGVRNVATLSLYADGDQFQLAWHLHSLDLGNADGVLEGSSIIHLAKQFGADTAARLARRNMNSASQPVPIADDFINEAYARAVQALENAKPDQAYWLLQVCLSVTPRPVEVDVAYLSCLVSLRHPSSEKIADELLARVKQLELPRLEGQVLRVIAADLIHRDRPSEAADRVDEAIRVFDELDSPADTAKALLRRIQVGLHLREYAFCYELLGRAKAISRSLGDKPLLAACLFYEGSLEMLEGELNLAEVLLEQAVSYAEEARLNFNRAIYLRRLGRVHYYRGELSLALRSAELARELLGAASSSQADDDEFLCELYGYQLLLGRIDAIDQLLGHRLAAIQEAPPSSPSPRLGGLSPFIAYSYGMRAWRLGEMDKADGFFTPELASHLRFKTRIWLNEMLGVFVRFAVAQDDLERATEYNAEYRKHPQFDHDVTLQGASALHDALIAHASNAPSTARRMLSRAVEILPVGPANALARFYSAWLATEAGDVAQARSLLEPLSTWLKEHPTGLLVLARIQHDSGEFAAAVVTHAHYRQRVGVSFNAVQADIAAAYEQARETGQAATFAPIGRLVDLW